jgi:uncharacterized protein YjbK
MAARSGNEIEVKERLAGVDDWQGVCTALGGRPTHVEDQTNFFFDGAAHELASNRASVRLRLIDGVRCLVTAKESSVLTAGVNTAHETEEYIDYDTASRITRSGADGDTALLFRVSAVAAAALRRYGVTEAGVRCIGSFRTLRQAFAVLPFDDDGGSGSGAGHTLELDRTDFGFATAFEVELETTQAKAPALRKALCAWLDATGIHHRPTKKTKLAIFMTGSID